MSLVKMKKFIVIGMGETKEAFMKDLMKLGVAELNEQDSKLAEEKWAALVSRETRTSKKRVLDRILHITETSIKTLDTYDDTRKPLFSEKRDVLEKEISLTQEETESQEEVVHKLHDHMACLEELNSERNRIETTIVGLKPWIDYTIPLDVQETTYTCIKTGIIPVKRDIEVINKAIKKKTEFFQLVPVGSDEEYRYISWICLKGEEDLIEKTLHQYGYSSIHFKDLSGTAKEAIACLEMELIHIAEREEETNLEIKDMIGCKDDIELYYDFLTIEKDRTDAFDKMLVTGKTFYLDGWVSERDAKKLAALTNVHGCFFELSEPSEAEQPPILFKNNAFIRPVESITSLFALPSPREVDPTPVFALFYICFFGIMFADIGYGLILAIASGIMVVSGKLGPSATKFIKQLGYCGVSATVWGFVFGSFFGNLISVTSITFGSGAVSLEPLWLNPVDNAMVLLVFSCALGLIHIFVAFGVKAYMLFKDGKPLEAINDALLWYVLIIGLVLLLAGDMLFNGASDVGFYMTIIGVSGIVVLPVFYAKGFGKLHGLGKLYGIIGIMSDVLSYSRLLALCLASAVIAQVFNILAGMTAGGPIGIVLFILIVLIAHIFNFLMSGLGAFVHSIRLQYVEFFGKFYEGHGVPFKQFIRTTRYVNIIREED